MGLSIKDILLLDYFDGKPAHHKGDLCLPCQRFGYCHHPAGRLAASGQRGPHQHPQHTGRKLALAAGTAPARYIGRAHRRADHAV